MIESCMLSGLEDDYKKRGGGTTMVVHEGAARSSQWCCIACESYRYQIRFAAEVKSRDDDIGIRKQHGHDRLQTRTVSIAML